MVHLLVGKNTYQRDQKLRTLIKDAESIDRLNGEEVAASELIQALSATSLFASESIVVVDSLGKNKAASDKIDDIITASEQGNDLILLEPSIDKRTSYYKTLKKKAQVAECEPLKEYEAATFVQQYVKEQGGSISKTDAETLVQRVGVDQQILVNEITKMLITNKHLDRDHIETHTDQRPEDSVFALTDALVAGRVDRAVQIYRELRTAGQQPYEIMGSLGWQLQVLVLINSVPSNNEHEIAGATKLHPFVVKKNSRVANRLQLAQLKTAVNDALAVDIQLKTTPAENDQLVEHLLYRLQHTLHT